MKIQSGKLVELDYQILDEEGRLYESSKDEGPLLYVQGAGELPEGLEAALDGASAGDELEVALAAGEAFDDYNPDGLITVPRDEFPEGVELEKGATIILHIEDDDGEDAGGEADAQEDEECDLEVRIVEVGPDGVVLDANHPLAGKAVTFRVKVLAVSEASEES